MAGMLREMFAFNLQGKTIDADATVGDALKAMQSGAQTCLLVREKGKRPVGIVSEHDIVNAFAKLGHEATRTKISSFMTIDVIVALDTDTVDEALNLMSEHNVRHLPVITADGALVDFLSVMDLVLCKLKERAA